MIWDRRLANLSAAQRLAKIGPALVFVVPAFTTTLAAVFVPAILISGMPFVYFADRREGRLLLTRRAFLDCDSSTDMVFPSVHARSRARISTRPGLLHLVLFGIFFSWLCGQQVVKFSSWAVGIQKAN